MFNPDQIYTAEQARRMELYQEAAAQRGETVEQGGLLAWLRQTVQRLARIRPVPQQPRPRVR